MMQLNVGEQWYSFNKDKYILEKLPLILLSFQDFCPSSLRWQIKYIFLCCNSFCDALKNILEIHLSYDHPRFLWRHGPEKSCAYTDTTTHMSSSQEFKVTANLCWQIKRPMLAIVTYYGASLKNQWERCSISWLNCSNHVHTVQMCVKHLSSIICSVATQYYMIPHQSFNTIAFLLIVPVLFCLFIQIYNGKIMRYFQKCVSFLIN